MTTLLVAPPAWVDHFRRRSNERVRWLLRDAVLTHPWVWRIRPQSIESAAPGQMTRQGTDTKSKKRPMKGRFAGGRAEALTCRLRA